MSNYITVRVELDDGTVAEKRAEIERIGNRRFLAYETLTAAESLTGDVVEMLRSLDLLKMKYICSCGDWEYRDDDRERACASWCGHVALVVEQHTNGRIAELEAAVRKRIQLLREHDGFGAAHADGYMGMNWTAYYEGAYQAQVMAAADLENDLRAASEGEQQ